MTHTEHVALLETSRRIAADIGRLRRTTPQGTSAWWALDRIAANLETIDNIVHPSAGELYQDYLAISGDHDVAAAEALRVVDARAHSLQELLQATPAQSLRAVA